MSVRLNERSKTTLEVLDDAKNLCDYTLTICKNEKYFPKSQRWMLTQKIVNETIDTVACIRHANSTYVRKEEKYQRDFEYRHRQQIEAHAHLDAILTLIDVAQKHLGIDPRQIEFWTGLILKTDNALKEWTNSDYDRFCLR